MAACRRVCYETCRMNYSVNLGSQGFSGDWLPYVLLLWGPIWLLNLALVLRRSDYDAITKLTWVIVIIFVPFFGVLLYWFIAPERARRGSAPLSDLSGMPWKSSACDPPPHGGGYGCSPSHPCCFSVSSNSGLAVE